MGLNIVQRIIKGNQLVGYVTDGHVNGQFINKENAISLAYKGLINNVKVHNGALKGINGFKVSSVPTVNINRNTVENNNVRQLNSLDKAIRMKKSLIHNINNNQYVREFIYSKKAREHSTPLDKDKKSDEYLTTIHVLKWREQGAKEHNTLETKFSIINYGDIVKNGFNDTLAFNIEITLYKGTRQVFNRKITERLQIDTYNKLLGWYDKNIGDAIKMSNKFKIRSLFITNRH